MSRKLLDLTNGSNQQLTRIPGLTDVDREILGAYLDQRRRDLREVVVVARFVASHQHDDNWTVTIDGQPLATFHALTDFGLPVDPPPPGASRRAVREWWERHLREPDDVRKEELREYWKAEPEADRRGKAIAVRLANDLRAGLSLPDWRHLEHASELSAVGYAQLATWLRQWQKHQTQRMRRCAQSTCGVTGGRVFVAKRNERDCPYCRARGGSKSTRHRRRKRSIIRPDNCPGQAPDMSD